MSSPLFLFYSNDFNQVAVSFYSSLFQVSLPGYIKVSSLQVLEETIASSDYAYVFVAPYYSDLFDVEKFRNKFCFRNVKYIYLDPRSSQNLSFVRSEDLVVIDSVEQFDFCCSATPNIFMYSEYPLFSPLPPATAPDTFTRSEPLKFFYHGNKRHLSNSRHSMLHAFLRLSSSYPVELHLVYNIADLGLYRLQHDSIFHHQWTPEICSELASTMHIGLCPQLIPARFNQKLFTPLWSRKSTGANYEDYLHRFKVPSNPGRIIANMRLGLASIADMTPSACQFIRHNHNGFLVSSAQGWYH